MNATPSRPIVADTAAAGSGGNKMLELTRAHLAAAAARGDLPAGTVLEREVIDVTRPGDSWRHLEPGAMTIKAGG